MIVNLLLAEFSSIRLLVAAKVVRIFLRQRRAVNSFLSSTNSIDRISYLRVIALASVDISLTLPMNVASSVLRIITLVEANSPPFYLGWSALHATLKPIRLRFAPGEGIR